MISDTPDNHFLIIHPASGSDVPKVPQSFVLCSANYAASDNILWSSVSYLISSCNSLYSPQACHFEHPKSLFLLLLLLPKIWGSRPQPPGLTPPSLTARSAGA